MMSKKFSLPNDNIDFECPYNMPWESKQDPNAKSIVQSQPIPGPAQVKTFIQAAAKGDYVSDEIIKERLNICRTCEFRRVTEQGNEWCGVCGCKISPDGRKIDNLAAHVEDLPKYGCKHINRNTGKGWKR